MRSFVRFCVKSLVTGTDTDSDSDLGSLVHNRNNYLFLSSSIESVRKVQKMTRSFYKKPLDLPKKGLYNIKVKCGETWSLLCPRRSACDTTIYLVYLP